MQHGLNPDFPDGQPAPFNGWRFFQSAAIFAIVWVAVFAVTGATVFTQPREYYSRVVVEVKPDGDVFQAGKAGDGNLARQQLPVFQSKEVLYPVIDNLKLAETWSASGDGRVLSKEEAYACLLGQLKVEQVRGTDMVEVGVFSHDRTEAANIANTVAVVYQKVRRDDQEKSREAALDGLRKEVESLRKNAQATDDAKATEALAEAERRLAAQTVEMKTLVVPAKIWEKAEPAIYPAKPDVQRINAQGAGAGVALGLLAAVLFLWIARRRASRPPIRGGELSPASDPRALDEWVAQPGEASVLPEGQPAPPNGRKFFQAAVIFAIVWAAAVAITGAAAYVLPRDFYSRVVMEVKGNDNRLVTFSRSGEVSPGRDLLDVPFQVIQSKEVLYPVIDELKLTETWAARQDDGVWPKPGVLSKQEVYAQLLSIMKLNKVRDTDLVEIGVFSPDRVEAANIANTIAVTFQKVLRDDEMQLRNAALEQLREEVQALRKKVDEAAPEGAAQARRVLEAAEQRLATQTAEIKMNTATTSVKIWERAEPAVYPAKPFFGRISALGAGVGIVLGLLAAGLFLRFGARGVRDVSL